MLKKMVPPWSKRRPACGQRGTEGQAGQLPWPVPGPRCPQAVGQAGRKGGRGHLGAFTREARGKTGERGSAGAAGAEGGGRLGQQGLTLGMETSSWSPGPHHECAADFGELPVGTILAEGTHPVLLCALTDLLPTGKRGAASSPSGLPPLPVGPFAGSFAPSTAVKPQQQHQHIGVQAPPPPPPRE